MAGVTVGSVHVDVVPSTEGFVRQMRSEILGEADKIGRELGERIGRDAANTASRRVTEGIEDGVDGADVEASAGKKGRDAGGRFAREFKARISAALNDLPTVDLDLDDSDLTEAQVELKELRKSLEALRKKTVGVDLDAGDAFGELVALRATLETLRDGSIELDFDVDSAIANLTTLQKQVARDFGGNFENTLRNSLGGALRDLPKLDLDLDLDENDARRALNAIRVDIQALSDLTDVELDIDSDFALAEIAELKARLAELVDDDTIDVKVRTNAAAALGQLEAVEKVQARINRGAEENERETGAFVRKFRADIEGLLRTIPDIEIKADTSQARRALTEVRSEFAALRDLEIGVDVDAGDALRQLSVLETVLEGLVNDKDIEVRFISRQALAEAQAFRAQLEASLADVEVGVQVEPRNPGAFATKLRSELARIQASLPDIDIGANITPAQRDVAVLRRDIGELGARIDINSNIPAVLAEITALQQRLAAVDGKNIDVDVAAAIASLAALTAAATAAGAAIDNANTRTARWRLILAAVVLLLPLIAGAVVALAGALALVVTPILAVAAGLDGIKKAIEPLKDDLNSLKIAVSAAFEQGLATSVARAAAAFPVFSAGLADTAGALSEVTNEILTVITSADNLVLIERNFDLINNVIRSLAPSLSSLAQNFTDFVTIGAQGMSSFGVEMTQVGDTWARVIQRLSGDSGTGQAAVRAFFQVFAELLNLLGPLTEFGAVLLATFGPALAGALSVLSGIFEAFAAVLDFLPGPLQTVVTAALLMSTTFLILGKTIPGTAASIAFLSGLFPTLALSTGIAATALRGFLALLGGPIGIAIIAVVTALSFLGQAQGAAAEEAAGHQAAIQSLGDAFEETNGAITANLRNQTTKTLIDQGAAEAANTLGLSMRDITEATLEQGPAFDTLVSTLEGYVAAGANAATITSEQGDDAFYAAQGAVAHGEAAQRLLDIVVPLGEEFRLTAENIRLYQEATGQAVTTAAVGVANAAALSEAIGVLGEESSTTSAKVTALTDALDALNGGVLTADEAAAGLRESISEIGKAFEEAQAATDKAGVSLIMANGAIDNTTTEGRALGEVLSGVRDSMIESATAAFDAAGGLTNVEAASAAAAGEVQVARDAFIEAAREAGISAEAANDLANRYGLIPSLVTTLLRADGLPVVNQDLITLSQRLDGIPANTEINVGILAEETFQVLRDLGITVERLPGGEVVVTATDETKPAIDNILGFIADSKGVLPVLGETTPVTIAAQRARDEIAAAPGRLPVELNRDGVGAALTAVRDQALNTVVEIPLNANDTLVRSKFEQVVANINASVALVNIDGTIQPATVALQQIITAINAGEGFVNIDGNDVPVSQALNNVMALIGSSTAAVEIGGDNIPASQVLSDTLAAIAAGQEFVTINGVDLPAQGILSALLGDVAASSAAIQVLADAAAANAAIDNAARTRTAVIRVVTTGANAANIGNSGLNSNSGQARGNFLVPMANGGVLGNTLTPLAARANKIAPNTWRVIGDNMRVPEVYAPLDGSNRSLSFLRAGIQSYGLDIAPMASGGLLDKTLNLASSLIPQGSGVQAQQVRPIAAPGTPGTREANTIGFGTDRVENKLDEIASLLRENAGGSGGASITVNDRSGNPVETARATQLALRLARR